MYVGKTQRASEVVIDLFFMGLLCPGPENIHSEVTSDRVKMLGGEFEFPGLYRATYLPME